MIGRGYYIILNKNDNMKIGKKKLLKLLFLILLKFRKHIKFYSLIIQKFLGISTIRPNTMLLEKKGNNLINLYTTSFEYYKPYK